MIKTITSQNKKILLDLYRNHYPDLEEETINQRLDEIFSYPHYYCWAYMLQDECLGICGAWITQRMYCGRQLEIDNFIVTEKYRSQGIGAELLQYVEQFAKEKKCETLELNSYVHASKAHKFYFRNDYRILGYHFEKKLDKS